MTTDKLLDGFVRVCDVSDLSDPGKITVHIGGRPVALFRIAGQMWATDARCTHDGTPLTSGTFENHVITCPRHGARFDVRTGRALCGPAFIDLAVHQVIIDGDSVLVRIDEDI